MRKITWSGPVTPATVAKTLPRASTTVDSSLEATAKLIQEVKDSGMQALLAHAERFDGVRPQNLRVPASALKTALAELDPNLRSAIEIAIDRVRKVSRASVPSDLRTELAPGAFVTTRFQPVDSVGVYVPGGKAVYPSSVVMNVVAAQEAGVKRIALATPAQKAFGGLPHPAILATAAILEVDEVYAIGGASAIAAFAFGVEEISLAPVRVVTGPGNIFVAAAKRLLRGQIGIDSEAGPTEILIIADDSANPAFIAADLISQAEHDENAAAVLVTHSKELIDLVQKELDVQLASTANQQRVTQSLSGEQSALVLTDSLHTSIAIANEYATEHLEIQVADNQKVLQQISNAGAIFLGPYSPVSLGDYLAGSNHVLPTSEQAKFGPGLGVHTFLRPQQIIEYSESALRQVSEPLQTFAKAEGLPAHGDASRIRFD